MNGPGKKRFGKKTRETSVAKEGGVDRGHGKKIRYKTLTSTSPKTPPTSKYRTQEQADASRKVQAKRAKVKSAMGGAKESSVVKKRLKAEGMSPRKLKKEGYLQKGYEVSTVGKGKVKKFRK